MPDLMHREAALRDQHLAEMRRALHDAKAEVAALKAELARLQDDYAGIMEELARHGS